MITINLINHIHSCHLDQLRASGLKGTTILTISNYKVIISHKHIL